MTTYKQSIAFKTEARNEAIGTLPYADTSSIGTDLAGWNEFKKILDEGVQSGKIVTDNVTSTYSLVYTAGNNYNGGVLAPMVIFILHLKPLIEAKKYLLLVLYQLIR